jgi:hypothetical protein
MIERRLEHLHGNLFQPFFPQPARRNAGHCMASNLGAWSRGPAFPRRDYISASMIRCVDAAGLARRRRSVFHATGSLSGSRAELLIERRICPGAVMLRRSEKRIIRSEQSGGKCAHNGTAFQCSHYKPSFRGGGSISQMAFDRRTRRRARRALDRRRCEASGRRYAARYSGSE